MGYVPADRQNCRSPILDECVHKQLADFRCDAVQNVAKPDPTTSTRMATDCDGDHRIFVEQLAVQPESLSQQLAAHMSLSCFVFFSCHAHAPQSNWVTARATMIGDLQQNLIKNVCIFAETKGGCGQRS